MAFYDFMIYNTRLWTDPSGQMSQVHMLVLLVYIPGAHDRGMSDPVVGPCRPMGHGTGLGTLLPVGQ